MSWKMPEEFVDAMIERSEEKVWEPFEGITIVAWKLPNGYTIVESSGCVDPSEYDRERGVELCRTALKRKLWQLEGYLAKERFSQESESK